MAKIQAMICSFLIFLGAADLLTTLIGVTGKGAVEINPLFATLTQTNILAFIGLKIFTVMLTGFMFLEAGRIAKASSSDFIRCFMIIGPTALCFAMTVVVANNVLVLLRIL
jgi:uncharacterized protein DUF5658